MPKILIIEDESALLEELIALLEFEDYEAVGALNGAEGVKMARQHLPDLIISDIMMPGGMDGYGVLMELQNDSRTATIPFLFMTAKTSPEEIRKGMNLGADDYITKPFTQEHLLGAIDIRLKRYAVLNKRYEDEVNILRDSITHSLPHELRTPLSSVLAYSDLILEDLPKIDAKSLQRMVEGIKRGGVRLFRVVENFLLFAQLDLVKREPHRAIELKKYLHDNPEYPARLVLDVADDLAQKANRLADLQVNIDDVALPVPADGVRKIIFELLDNAFKFSQAGTPITIEAHMNGQGYELIITDKGRGIAPEQLERLGAYVQFERRLHEQQGLGLGLTIARLLTEMLGGSFNIQSEVKVGTTVQVIFPTT